MDVTASGRLVSVNVVAQLHDDVGRSVRSTAIDKRAVAGRVAVGPLGVAGDRQLNRKYHGGPDKAVYAFAREDVVHWEVELGRPVEPGGFGENFSTIGLAVSDALIGERWRVGAFDDALVVEVTMPRTPCMTFARWVGEQRRGWVRRFAAHGRVGSYLRVVTPGTVQAGDAVTVSHRPEHGVSTGAVLRGLSLDEACALETAQLRGDVRLCREVQQAVRQVLDRADRL